MLSPEPLLQEGADSGEASKLCPPGGTAAACPQTGREDSWRLEPKGRTGPWKGRKQEQTVHMLASRQMRAENTAATKHWGSVACRRGPPRPSAFSPTMLLRCGPREGMGPKTRLDTEVFREPEQLCGGRSIEEKWFGSRNEEAARGRPPPLSLQRGLGSSLWDREAVERPVSGGNVQKRGDKTTEASHSKGPQEEKPPSPFPQPNPYLLTQRNHTVRAPAVFCWALSGNPAGTGGSSAAVADGSPEARATWAEEGRDEERGHRQARAECSRAVH